LILVRIRGDIFERFFEVRRIDRQRLNVLRFQQCRSSDEVLELEVVEKRRFVGSREVELSVGIKLEPFVPPFDQPFVHLVQL
jgi:hypothetical protein